MPVKDNEASDFGAILDAGMARLRTEVNIGDRVEGVVTMVGRNSIFLDLNARSDGVLDRADYVDENGEVTVKEGDRITAYCVGTGDDTIQLARRMTGRAEEASLWEAYESEIPLEGRVEGERKGGYDVRIASHVAFCPYSQVDLYRKEAEEHIGQKYSFLITEYEEGGRNMIVSRRKLLERERAQNREQLQETLETGQFVSGKVTKLMPFGVFVDIGGAEGLVPLRELGWGRDIQPEDVVSEGDEVTVLVKEIDWENDRISLSLKQAQNDPWTKLEESTTYVIGTRHTGVVMQLQQFGAFVQLEPGIEGLVHISRLGAGRRINHPDEVVAVGDHVEVSIESIDLERHRISLSMDSTSGIEDEDIAVDSDAPAEDVAIVEGRTMKGVVDGLRDFGVFIRLPNGDNGLLHVSQVELRGSTNRRRALHDMFPPGSEVEVVIKELKGDRISLTLPETLAKEAESLDLKDFQDGNGGGLGSLGDVFGNLKL